MLFYQGLRERQLIVRTPQDVELARVVLPGYEIKSELTPALRTQLEKAPDSILVEPGRALAWTFRTLFYDAKPIARIYAELDLSEDFRQRATLRRWLIMTTLAASLATAGLAYVLLRRMLRPVRSLASRLDAAPTGGLSPIPDGELGAAATEFGQLQRGYNVLVHAVREREELAARIAEAERMTVLGRLAATIAHEVRNPLGGMLNTVDTMRKFGADGSIRAKSIDLIERGLMSIRDVVGATLATYRAPESGRPLRPQDIDDVRILIEPEARRRNVTLAWSSSLPPELALDATKVRQLVLNLLLNACMASPRDGTIEFRASIPDGALLIVVADEGPGLPPRIAAAIRTTGPGPVVRPDAPGIGLWIVMRIVHELGGRIDAAPGRGGQGTRIVATLPLPAEKVADEAA